MEKRKKADERAWIEQIIAETEADFAARQEERAALEKQWELNMQFLIGNQYAEVSSRGEIVERDDAFLWQERRVFNHIAPLVESRAAKFSRVRPKLAVTPLSDDDDEITNARLAGRVVETAFEKADFDAVASEVTRWSEVCGTGFYKIVWDAEAGKKVGVTEDGDIFEGDVRLAAVPPFEIYPDSLYAAPAEVRSLIHARCVAAEEVYRLYGKRVAGGGAFGDGNLGVVNVLAQSHDADGNRPVVGSRDGRRQHRQRQQQGGEANNHFFHLLIFPFVNRSITAFRTVSAANSDFPRSRRGKRRNDTNIE